MDEHKNSFGYTVKVFHNASELVSNAIVEELMLFAGWVKTLTFHNCIGFVL
jgi:hypothetical protein